MIGGGLGSGYPQWARQEFIRKKREADAKKGPEAFYRLAVEAQLVHFDVIGEGGLGPEDPNSGVGIWLQFKKEI